MARQQRTLVRILSYVHFPSVVWGKVLRRYTCAYVASTNHNYIDDQKNKEKDKLALEGGSFELFLHIAQKHSLIFWRLLMYKTSSAFSSAFKVFFKKSTCIDYLVQFPYSNLLICSIISGVQYMAASVQTLKYRKNYVSWNRCILTSTPLRVSFSSRSCAFL